MSARRQEPRRSYGDRWCSRRHETDHELLPLAFDRHRLIRLVRFHLRGAVSQFDRSHGFNYSNIRNCQWRVERNDTTQPLTIYFRRFDTEPFYDNLPIYPNPTSGLVHLRFNPVISGRAELIVESPAGRTLFKILTRTSDYKTEMDLTELAKGICFINLETGDHIQTGKLVFSK